MSCVYEIAYMGSSIIVSFVISEFSEYLIVSFVSSEF